MLGQLLALLVQGATDDSVGVAFVERGLTRMARLHRLARGCERLAGTQAELYFVAFAILVVHRFVTLGQSA